VLTHILQSALCFGVDLAFAFPALALVKREPPVSVRKISATITTLPAQRLAICEGPEKAAAVVDKAAEKPLHTRVSA
jgi:hypothetical protein